LRLNQGNVIRLTTNSQSIELPVYIQPGQHKNVIVVALGYGSLKTARFRDIGPKWFQGKPTLAEGELIGQNITPFLKNAGTSKEYSGIPITISNTSRSVDLALSQTYNTLSHPEKTTPPAMKTRPIIQTATFEEYEKDPRSGQHKSHALVSLWKEDHLFKGHHWGMAIDLSACTGCSACVVSCQVENNIPVVGRDEVLRRREMHWLRIDRYYSGENENIDVVFQPMLCQHCDNAPCEPVCPVLATVHSSEGLNQQIYNRCIGTRFCANNCPYKVRRFNWFNYTHDDLLENMVLNPDVTIRSRGVMEKCSLCVQRIQEAKIEAKRKGIKIKDGDIQLACQQSCPADAITFGDLSDPKSKIAKQVQDPRHYHVLEEINVRPTTGYLTLIRNRKEEMDSEHNG
jgi:molybdopterin-containing oxidoreductase family iron-sulfur binding subunit